MKLAPAAEFAVRGVLVLAERYGEGPVTLDAICSARCLSKEYLAKIFGSLVRADIIAPVRGKHGGYMLARPPGEISLLEVIEAVEGPVAMNFCQHDAPQCDRVDCLIRPVWGEIQSFVRGRLASVRLTDCLTSAVGKPAR
jgi:Rrf2 family protein